MEKYFNINENGCCIKCKVYCNEESQWENVIVCCHGFVGNKEDESFPPLAEKILPWQHNAALLAFDLPGHGAAAGTKIDLDSCNSYLNAVVKYLREELAVENIYAQGVSFGGYLLLKYIHEQGNPFKRIALRCPAVTMYQALTDIIMTAADHEAIAQTNAAVVGFEDKVTITGDFLKQLREADIIDWDFRSYAEQLLIIHGKADEIVPFAKVSKFAAANHIPFIPVENADHRFLNPAQKDKAIADAAEFLLPRC